MKAEGRDNDLCQPIHSARVAASDRPGKALGRVLDVDARLQDNRGAPKLRFSPFTRHRTEVSFVSLSALNQAPLSALNQAHSLDVIT